MTVSNGRSIIKDTISIKGGATVKRGGQAATYGERLLLEKQKNGNLTEDERKFLALANTPELRANLLEHLEQLGLLSAFLAAESETN